jgi:hypothetical protein
LHHFHVLNFDQFRLRFRDVSRRIQNFHCC